MMLYVLIGVVGFDVEIVNEWMQHAKVCEGVEDGWSGNCHGLTKNHSYVLVVNLVQIPTEQSTEGCWISVRVCFDTSGKTKGHEMNPTHGQLHIRAGTR